MEFRDGVNRLRTDLGGLLQQGQQFVQIPALLEYLSSLESEAPAISQAAELQHQSQLAFHRAVHESNLEMFKSVIEAGRTAVTTAILVSGGATAALLAFVGNSEAKALASHVPPPIIGALMCFAAGVLLAALGSGARYLAQASYSLEWRRSAFGFNATCIAMIIASYVLFIVGVIAAYHGFIQLP